MCAAAYRIEPLNAENFCTWKLQMRAILIKNDLWQYVDGTVERPTEAVAYATWKKVDEKACADITLSIAPPELGVIGDCESSKDIWKKLEDTFQSKGPAKKATLLKRVALSSLKEGDCVREHLNAYFDAVKKLKDIGVEIGDDLLAILLLYSLPPSFETFRVALETRDDLPKPNDLRVKILEEFESRRAKEDRSDQNALFAHKAVTYKFNHDGAKYNQNKRIVTCYKCRKQGHLARQCKSGNRKNVDNKRYQNKDAILLSTESTSLCGTSDMWCLDSGCTSHMCSDPTSFEHLRNENKTLHLANNKTAQIKGSGVVNIDVKNGNENINLNDVLYVEDLRTNLLSISKITDKGYEVKFDKNTAKIVEVKSKKCLCIAQRIGNLYYLKENRHSAKFAHNSKNKNDIDIWHEKMGHLNEEDLKKMIKNKLVHGLNINIEQKLTLCEICLSEKQTQNHFIKSQRQTSNLLDIVHSDVCGPMSVNSFSGARYFVSFIDDKSRYCHIYFLKKKSEVFNAFKKFKAVAELQTGRKIKALQSDNGGEYRSKAFDSFIEECGIKRRFSTPHTPQQNGVAERKNRTLIDMARCMLKQSGARLSFWAEAVNTACYIRNRCPTRSLNGEIPYTIWTNKIPVLAHMQVFGTKTYVLNKGFKSKFEARSRPCVFVGYASDAKAFRLWDPDSQNIVISRDVKFTNINGFDNKLKNKEITNPSTCVEIFYEQQAANPVVLEAPDADGEFNAVNVEGEYNTAGANNEHNVAEAGSEHNQHLLHAKGRPTFCRTGLRGRPKKVYQLQKRDPADGETTVCEHGEEFNQEEFANFTVSEDPINISDALNSVEAELWLNAMHNEYLVQLKNKTWEIVERPKSRKIIGHKLVFKTKENGSKKVRLVAKGCAQRPGVDFFDVYSPVVRPSSVRLIAALSAEMSLEIHQMDVVAAYLNGELSEEVYMEIPENLIVFLKNYIADNTNKTEMFETAKRWVEAYRQFPNGVCVIKKTLYGLRQSGLRWYEKLSTKLKETGLKPSKQDPCLFIDRKEQSVMLVAIYVDDLLIASSDANWIKALKNTLSTVFDMKDMGFVKTYLGVDFFHDVEGISMSQLSYTTLVLKRFDMLNCKSVKTPIEPKNVLLRPDSADQSFMAKFPYQRLIGSLMYLAVTTRPDIAYAVTYLSQFNTAYGPEHWTAAKRVLRYLKGTMNFGLSFKKTDKALYGVADADWASDSNDRKSYSGFAFILSGAAICWEARKQRTVTLSSTESEYMAITEATKEAMYLKNILSEIGQLCQTVTLYNDSQSAQKLIRSVGYHSRTKHIDTRHYFIKEKLTEGVINIEYMSTDEMPADVLTKGLSAIKHLRCITKLGLKDVHI